MKKKFIRSDYTRYSKLGKNRKKLQKWRKSKGRHSKIRQKWGSHPKAPSVGFKTPKKESGKINDKFPIIVRNVKDLGKADKSNVIILGKIGAKKKLEIIKLADELKIQIVNVRRSKE